MDELVMHILPSFLWGVISGLTFVLANWFVNFMWRTASRDGSTKAQAVMLYLGAQIGGIIILVIYMGIAFVCIKNLYRHDDMGTPIAMLSATVLVVVVAVKQRWFRPSATGYKQFMTEKPSD